jgi:hypothetical protein
MADPVTEAAVTPGIQTSEFKLAAVSQVLGILATVIPTLLTLFTDLKTSYPNWTWLGPLIGGLGIAATVLTSLGYTKARAAIKVAALQAGKVMLVLFLALSALAGQGCSLFTPTVVHDLEVCGRQAVAALVPEAVQTILALLSGNAINAAQMIADYVAKVGPAGECAFNVVLAQLETGMSTAPLANGQPMKTSREVQLATMIQAKGLLAKAAHK